MHNRRRMAWMLLCLYAFPTGWLFAFVSGYRLAMHMSYVEVLFLLSPVLYGIGMYAFHRAVKD